MSLVRFFIAVAVTLVLVLHSCGGWTEYESRRFHQWLTCEECTGGELAFVRDTLGDRAREPLRRILLDMPPEYLEGARQGIDAAMPDLPSAADATAYQAFYEDNFEATLQRRAAIGLAALGDTATLREAIDRASVIGYRSDVVDLMEQALAGLAAPGGVSVAAGTVIVMPDALTLTVGDTSFLAATVRDVDGRPVGGPIGWSSSDDTVVEVVSPRRGQGEVRGLAPGSAVVTAAWSGQSAAATVQVLPALASPPSLIIVGDAVRVDSANTPLDSPLLVRLVDSTGAAIPRVVVTFRIVRGTRSGMAAAVTTDPSGEATWAPALGQTPEVMWVDAEALSQRVRFSIRTRSP